MKLFVTTLVLCMLGLSQSVSAQSVTKNVPYVDSAEANQKLDIYAPARAEKLPVVFWIHGGGWQAGDKSEVEVKPQLFMDKGCVFVSTNYRMLPHVDMGTLIRDCALAMKWVHANIDKHGGDPNRILIMGHSAGAQLAAILCTDDRYLKEVGVPFSAVQGCVPVDGDTYDIPAIITTAEIRRRVHELPQAKVGHREKFGNDPEKHIDFSAVTHIRKDKGIPPFLILYVNGHPDTTAQAQRLHNVLTANGIKSKLFGAKDTDHSKLNDNLGKADDPATKELTQFLTDALKQ